MKLFEIAPDFVRSQVGTLMTILQYLQSKTKPGTKIPMQNVTNLMNNAGYPFDWRALEGLKKKYKALDELIGNFDEDSLTLGKSDDELDNDIGDDMGGDIGDNQEPTNDLDNAFNIEPASQPTTPQEPEVDIADGRNPERSTVDKMAARAARF
jgi:hypothetical protein